MERGSRGLPDIVVVWTIFAEIETRIHQVQYVGLLEDIQSLTRNMTKIFSFCCLEPFTSLFRSMESKIMHFRHTRTGNRVHIFLAVYSRTLLSIFENWFHNIDCQAHAHLSINHFQVVSYVV
jgi:hypothetical protein